jgi:15,16-dihydrobiliverdin:ferredoxin oxidoreductase
MQALTIALVASALSPGGRARTSPRCHALPPRSAQSMDRLAVEAQGRASIHSEAIPKLYWPMLEHLFKTMNERLPGLRDLAFDDDLELAVSAAPRPASRMESWCFQSDHFRKIRCTYIDAGPQAQVLNSLWYPQPQYDLPVLGLDLLSFGEKKLCVIDMQPLPASRERHHELVRPLDAVRQKYPLFLGEKSNKIYDDNLFFSPVMLFGRFKDRHEVDNTLYPVFCEYLDFYIDLVKGCAPDHDAALMATVLDGHREYDQYNSERDPAIGLFKSYYGDGFAQRYVYDFLFTSAHPVVGGHH